MKKIQDGFVRDPNNPGAVINTDNAALKAYKLTKQKNKEVEQLKQDVNNIKNMLSLILTKLN